MSFGSIHTVFGYRQLAFQTVCNFGLAKLASFIRQPIYSPPFLIYTVAGLYFTDVVFLKSLTNIVFFPTDAAVHTPSPCQIILISSTSLPGLLNYINWHLKQINLFDFRYCSVQMAITPISMLNACTNWQLLSTLRVPSVAFNLPMQSSQLLFDVAKGINSVTQGLFLNQHFPGVLMKQQVCSTPLNPLWGLFLYGSRAMVESKPKWHL